jgi:integrase
MAFVYKRKKKDGSLSPEYWYGFKAADGSTKRAKGTINKAQTLQIAQKREAEELLVREGVTRSSDRIARTAATRPFKEHLDDYRAHLVSKHDGLKHINQTIGAIKRLLQLAGITSLAQMHQATRLQLALGKLRETRSARTANHARTAILGWIKWLGDESRLSEQPAGLGAIKPFNQRVDRRRVRRAITKPELDKLLATTEAGPDEYTYGPTKSKHNKIPLSGLDRAMLYRVAMGTGFRASELRILTPENFSLNDQFPSIRVAAGYTKNKKEARQPIRRDLADKLAHWLVGKPPGKPLWQFDKLATLLQRDLERAGIPYIDKDGQVLDGHALRHSFITHLIQSGANPKEAQTLARHSTISLTMDTYAHVEDSDIRKAIERTKPDEPVKPDGSGVSAS